MPYAVTLNDIQKRLGADNAFQPIIEILKQSNPILEDMPFAEGDLPIGNKTTIRTSLPSPSIRRANRGTAPTKSDVKQVIDQCMYLEDRSCVDTLLLKGKPNPEAYRAAEDDAHVEGMGQYVAKVFMYGDLTDPAYSDTFNGLLVRYPVEEGDKGTRGYQVISAGTKNTKGHNTSAVIVDWGDRKVTGIYPKGMTAGLNTKDLGESDVYDSDGNPFRAVQTLYSWQVGLAVQNVRSVAAIRNIDVDALTAFTADQEAKFMNKIIFAKNRIQLPKSPIMYVGDTLYSYLETFLLNKNNVHVTREMRENEPPLLRFSGIPVKKMDCMTDTEAGF
ncbi:major capsid protein [Acidaminococcus massiliensis]|uniref:major capsid protein n=1 Tax=Acidaminococcus massiliensis TaxID=1852375 RepID=UPI0022DFBC80|nr:hypothetical protein [Acidaminococcus massiliensis]